MRYYATDDGKKGKGGKGTTAKVEECIPGSSKKIPAASMKPCPPPKIKIPSSAPVKPPPQVCCYPPKPDVCDQQPCYDPCRPGPALIKSTYNYREKFFLIYKTFLQVG